MSEEFSRTELLIGRDSVNKLSQCRIAVFGVGGVGGYVCEALTRSGVGEFDLIDNDTVCLSNINRQIIATHSTIGEYKVDVMAARMKDINPDVIVHTHKCFFLPENSKDFPFDQYDYIVDAIDTVTAKIELVMQAQAAQVPIISAMGAGNKLDPTRFKIADIYDTSICPLARIMRRELKKRDVKSLKVIFSDEKPIAPISESNSDSVSSALAEKSVQSSPGRRSTPGSTAFVPSVVGLILAGEIVRDLTQD